MGEKKRINFSLQRVVIVLFIIGSVWWGLYLISPPTPKPADAPETVFSAERAFSHVESIAQKSHVPGAPEHDTVRRYILEELDILGLNPRVHKRLASSQLRGTRVAEIHNITARLKGTNPEQTIMLMAHYDSAPYTPGAADDASGVAAILEAMRALKAGPPLKNDVLILLTDGEELGLLGARQFARSNPLLKEIDLILNFEARGSSGPAVMFETNTGNANLIPLFADFSPHPVGNSLTYNIYKILPNDTDFSVFKPHGVQGLNFAFIQDFLNYHTMQDHPDNLSAATLQHQGENLLGNIRGFGSQHFDLASSSDLVYFNHPLGGLVYYPENWSFFLTGITVLLLLFGIIRGYQRGWISATRVLYGLIGYLVILLSSGLITWLAWELIRQYIFPQYQWLQHGETYAHSWYLWFFISLSLLIVLYPCRWIKHKINIYNLLSSIYLTLITLLIALTVLLPAASYLLLWPILFGLTGSVIVARDLKRTEIRWGFAAILLASQFMTLFLLPFYVKFIQAALTTRFLWISILLTGLMTGLLFPLLNHLIDTAPRLFFTAFASVALICFTGAALNSDYSKFQKKQNSLIHASNLDTGNSYWLSADHTVDGWTSEFLGVHPEDSLFTSFGLVSASRVLYAPAPPLAIDAPNIKRLESRANDSTHSTILQVTHTHPATATSFTFLGTPSDYTVTLEKGAPADGSVSSYTQTISSNEFTYYGDLPPSDPLYIILPDKTNELEIRISSYHLQLPEVLMQHYRPRAPHMMPKPVGFSNGTAWTKTVHLQEL
ncbi:M20/M25/M40 family metallo-hydrolase [Halalkalibaculum sp. DA384]|uniref:M20/M25/M40 family metallo-hydrolase n=1 Tax=Halalkalibaculum sp. DA384 TaxID=3373606 RepID=UPI00375461DE